ncbi:MAG: CDP-glycerol glycerophosphotransferase family protein, partial [Tetragenococcus koreensis]|nr:CDP-glycerol glycerophosphotransferase family protein [Tetragenococcus koreensis]
MYPDIELVWLFQSPEEKAKVIPDYIRTVKFNSLKSFYELATAKVWIDNFNKPSFLFKGDKQFYIQTWHGDKGIKKILYDVRTQLSDGSYLEGDLFEENHCDLAIAGSEYGELKHYRSGFNYQGEILKEGSPRNDKLINRSDEKITAVKNKLGIESETRILLFAPTMRESDENARHKVEGINLEETLDLMEKETGKKWVCLIRAHSSTKSLEGLPQTDRFLNVSDFEDMSDLLLVSDILITDYSSSAGDFALLDRLVILFQNDRDEYISKDRKLYFDIDESPYLVALNQEELNGLLCNYYKLDIEKNCKDILSFYGSYETGQASERIAEKIKTFIRSEKA